MVFGIIAHVDAGKTTLAEALLYNTGARRSLGRVDHGDTALDTHAMEKKRGITIFSSGATISKNNREWTLLDTPGHVDFSSEMERTLGVLDAALLIISGTDGIQAHTRTLWQLLKIREIPTWIFVTKMDRETSDPVSVLTSLQKEFSDRIVNFSDEENRMENLALQREDWMETFLSEQTIPGKEITDAIQNRHIFPLFFGSGLTGEGVEEFLKGLENFSREPEYGDAFGGKVYKIARDTNGVRTTYLKVTGGTLKIRGTIGDEKITKMETFQGAKLVQTEEVTAGAIAVCQGLASTFAGQGLGMEEAEPGPMLEPVMSYHIRLPEQVNPMEVWPKLKLLGEEDPSLAMTYEEALGAIGVHLMGDIQIEVLAGLIQDRFGLDVTFEDGRIIYKETIASRVEGIGHYEPLKHYAEVHLLLEPIPRGGGIQIGTCCSTDTLAAHWQQLIMTHIGEKTHKGILTGAPLTDIRITVATGRAHPKHTEGGDFREATYRAIRQGLMQAESVLLEPYGSFRLSLPREQIGRGMTDLRERFADCQDPVESGDRFILTGRGPIATLNDYGKEVAAYSHGLGAFSLQPEGYDVCHNPKEVIAASGYEPTRDLLNSPDSVFCSHGAGTVIPWNEVSAHMHCPAILKSRKSLDGHRRLQIDDAEMRAIIARTLGPEKRVLPRPAEAAVSIPRSEHIELLERDRTLFVDGYNVIFSWEDLKDIASVNMDSARSQLINILANYSAYTQCDTTVIFDAYQVPGGRRHMEDINGIHVIFTRENETADLYIERLAMQNKKKENVRIVTSDGLIQVAAVSAGILRVSAKEFLTEVDRIGREINLLLEDCNRPIHGHLGNQMKATLNDSESDA